MAYKKYSCRFFSENTIAGVSDLEFQIGIFKETGSGTAVDFKCTSEGFTLKMDGGDDPLSSCIKTTSCEFNMIIEGAAQEQIIDDILSVTTGNEDEFSVKISINHPTHGFCTLWRGVLLGDLVEVEDVGINNIVKIQATDGLGRLKYRTFDNTQHGGTRSMMYLIKACLREIPLISNNYGTGDNFIAHTPFYYCKAMAGGLTGADGVDSTTWRENVSHDPLNLTEINTEIFKNDDGEYFNYYDILEQILGAFQLRLMMQMIDPEVSSPQAMWFLQSPFIYHDFSGNQDTSSLLFFHGNNLNTEDALSYKNDFETKIVNPSQRLSGGMNTFTPPLLNYKSIYNHKIMQNMALGPLSFNSFEYSEANPTSTADLIMDTENNNFEYVLRKDNETQNIPGDIGFAEPSFTKILVTGDVEYVPYHWSAWDFYNQNNIDGSFWGTGYRFAFINQYVAARMGLMVSSFSEFVLDGDEEEELNFYYLGSGRFGTLTGSVPWIGPSESNAASPIPGYWNTTWPNLWNYESIETGQLVYPWGTDVGADSDFIYWGKRSNTDLNGHWHFFSPYIHYKNGYLIGTADSFDGFNEGWGLYAYEQTLSSGVQSFAIESPPVPIVGHQSGFTPDTGYIKHIDLIYGFGQDMWNNDGGANYYTCSLDWSNQKELLHENRGIGFGYNLNNVRVFILGNDNLDDGYFDYSIGKFVNNNGTPSDAETQDPEIIIGDQPDYHGLAVSDANVGVESVYFGQFIIRNTNAATNTNSPYFGGEDAKNWIASWESDNSGNYLKLHEKRCKMEVAHRFKLGLKLDISFRDKSYSSNDWIMTQLGFAGCYVWTSGGTEQSSWVDKLFMVSGGEFNAGTMTWDFVLQECNNFSFSNLINQSYSNNNTE